MTSFKPSRRRMLALLGVQSAVLPSVVSCGSAADQSMSATTNAALGQSGPDGTMLYPRTSAEISARVTPANFAYPPGNPRRYGAVGDGVADDTAALTACISCNESYVGNEGDIYGVITVTFPGRGPRVIRFNGSRIRGIGTGAEGSISAAVVIRSNYANFYDYWVDLIGGGGIATPNPAYICATWWSNATGTQFNIIYGCLHQSCRRAMVYGALPGHPATTVIQSENVIHGWRTNGVSNPFYQNSIEGYIHFIAPTFFRDASTWTIPLLPVTARAVENEVGALLVQGGEIIFSNSRVGFGCDLQRATIDGAYWEGAAPVQIIGDGVQINGGSYQLLPRAVSAITVKAEVAGVLTLNGLQLFREKDVGATDYTDMIDCSGTGAFEVGLNNTQSSEWPWRKANGNSSLVKRNDAGTTVVRYRNHRMSITAADPYSYILDTDPTDSLLSGSQVDHMGYTTAGWKLIASADGTILASTTSKGPVSYLAGQLTLKANGPAIVISGDPTNLSTIQHSMLRVRPGEGYWISSWMRMAAGKQSALIASFYALNGEAVSSNPIADQNSIGHDVWTLSEGPITVPAAAAYMAIGVSSPGAAEILFTDMRVRRA
jgi:hypothetical protein